jgi:hypothetical protein
VISKWWLRSLQKTHRKAASALKTVLWGSGVVYPKTTWELGRDKGTKRKTSAERRAALCIELNLN